MKTDAPQKMVEHPIKDPTFTLAAALIDRRSLRALDSLQLATALTAAASIAPADRLIFIASDQRLLRAAVAEGLAAWDPTVSPRPEL